MGEVGRMLWCAGRAFCLSGDPVVLDDEDCRDGLGVKRCRDGEVVGAIPWDVKSVVPAVAEEE